MTKCSMYTQLGTWCTCSLRGAHACTSLMLTVGLQLCSATVRQPTGGLSGKPACLPCVGRENDGDSECCQEHQLQVVVCKSPNGCDTEHSPLKLLCSASAS
jgi:hypothetical protein